MSNYAIIAGKGELPKIIADELKTAKIICFDGEYNHELKPDLVTKFGKIGEVLEFLKANQIEKVVFAGAMQRPDLKKISLDSEGTKLFAKIMAGSLFGKSVGDDKLLSTITKFIEDKGYKVVGAHEIMDKLKTPKSLLTKKAPNEVQKRDIEVGLAALRKMGELDIGQAIVVEDGVVLAIEAVEGTKAMIARAGELKKSYGGVLVKCKKPGQDERVDLPAIGVETIEQLQAAGISGVGLEAGGSIIIGGEELTKKADEADLFVIGV